MNRISAPFWFSYFTLAVTFFFFSPPNSLAGDWRGEIDRLCSLPEDKIDIAIVSLTLAKEINPELDVEAYSAKVDEMVQGARALTKGSTDPDYRVRALNTYLVKKRGIEYDLSDPQAQEPENRYLNGILDTKKGSCITMPLLYLAVAQRLGYPVYPVALPWHVILRYVDPAFKQQNIETTGCGGYVPDGEYTEVFQISERAIKSGAYLRTLTYREFLGELIAQNGACWGNRGNHDRAATYFEKAANLNPRSADILRMLGLAHLELSKTANGNLAIDLRNQAQLFINMARAKGVTELSNDNYLEQRRKAQEKYRREHKEE